MDVIMDVIAHYDLLVANVIETDNAYIIASRK